MALSLDAITQALGHPPNEGGRQAELTLGRLLNTKPHLAIYVREYLVSQGIPKPSAQRAQTASLIVAYVNAAYRTSWCNRVNPNWALLGDGGDDEETVESKHGSRLLPKAKPMRHG